MTQEVSLGDDLVAQVWRNRTGQQLRRLRDFYESPRTCGFGLDTPRIRRVLLVGEQVVTMEERLRGRPLRAGRGDASYHLTDADIECVLAVLAALTRVRPRLGASLPVLDDEPPFRADRQFDLSLADLVERRTRRSAGALAGRLPDVGWIASATTSRLRQRVAAAPALVHGDLIPGNTFVDHHTRPLAVLDFGFLTTIGDPRFDAAVTASIYDMYGPRARTTEAILDDAVVARFGYDRHDLVLYQAAYALVTSNCFSRSGSDGHFDWCVAMLRRTDLRQALE